MSDIIDRIKEIRKDKNLNQTEFGERIGVSRDVIKNIELRKVSPRDLIIKQICKEYNVDPEWLIDGTGNMYLETSDRFIETLKKTYNLDDVGVSILTTYLSLSDDNKKVVKDFIKKVAKGLE